MISYTITVQKTQGQYRVSETNKYEYTLNVDVEPGDSQYFPQDAPFFLPGTRNEALTYVTFYSSDGGESFSTSITNSASREDNDNAFSASSSFTESRLYIQDSNLGVIVEYASAFTDYYLDPFAGEEFSNFITTEGTQTTETLSSISPTTISAATSTTSEVTTNARTTEAKTALIRTGTTIASQAGTGSTVVATTKYIESQSTVATFVNVPTTITTTISYEVETQLVTGDNGVIFPPRHTATVFQEFKNDLVWIPTATALEGPGPWPLSDIASSHTIAVTALPLYTTSPLTVIDASAATFPEDTAPAATETVTTTTFDGNTTFTFWRLNRASGFPYTTAFPLASTEIVRPKVTTTAQDFTYNTFTENNSAITQEAVEIDSQPAFSVQVINHGFSFQEFPVFSFTTTRYTGTWSQTSSYSYSGFATYNNGESELTFTNLTINEEGGKTIEGTNVEFILVRAFTPVAVSHNETSFTEAWGLHGSVPQSLISNPVSLRWRDFAELHPGVSVPYPSSTSWQSGGSSLSASILGNAITVTTSAGSGSEGGSTSSTYQFEGEEPAHTEQLTGREFFTSLGQLSTFTFFGPHAATGSVETRARPGTYVQISQDSLGDYTLNTLTLEESSAATISQNALLYPAEQSFYTSNSGEAFLVRPRNPTP